MARDGGAWILPSSKVQADDLHRCVDPARRVAAIDDLDVSQAWWRLASWAQDPGGPAGAAVDRDIHRSTAEQRPPFGDADRLVEGEDGQVPE
jgi:hypothetical protein